MRMNAYLQKFVGQWLNIITYPWISAPFGEISHCGYSSLLLLDERLAGYSAGIQQM